MNITVHDHVIVTQAGYYSFKSFGLICSRASSWRVFAGLSFRRAFLRAFGGRFMQRVNDTCARIATVTPNDTVDGICVPRKSAMKIFVPMKMGTSESEYLRYSNRCSIADNAKYSARRPGSRRYYWYRPHTHRWYGKMAGRSPARK